jgi:hypothetical protein
VQASILFARLRRQCHSTNFKTESFTSTEALSVSGRVQCSRFAQVYTRCANMASVNSPGTNIIESVAILQIKRQKQMSICDSQALRVPPSLVMCS